MEFHTPVLLQEAIRFLNVRKGKRYIDATLGGGGHTFEIVKRGGIVLGIDQDKEAIEYVGRKLKTGREPMLAYGNFKDIEEIARAHGFEKVSGVLFDLGLSRYQIEQSGRGFSFLRDEPLDMRMNPQGGIRAADIINFWKEEELYVLFSQMGEERFARAIAHNIVRARRVKAITHTAEFARLVGEGVEEKRSIHPATKTFMALRMVVNNELENLSIGLGGAWRLVETDGTVVVISFHSLEDRIVKGTFKGFEGRGEGRVLTKKPVCAEFRERRANPRSRSAKLRAIRKL